MAAWPLRTLSHRGRAAAAAAAAAPSNYCPTGLEEILMCVSTWAFIIIIVIISFG